MRRLLAHFLEDSTVANTMLDELLTSATDRCTEPALLDAAVCSFWLISTYLYILHTSEDVSFLHEFN